MASCDMSCRHGDSPLSSPCSERGPVHHYCCHVRNASTPLWMILMFNLQLKDSQISERTLRRRENEREVLKSGGLSSGQWDSLVLMSFCVGIRQHLSLLHISSLLLHGGAVNLKDVMHQTCSLTGFLF